MYFILYNPRCPLMGIKTSHKHEDPKLCWLITSYQQDVGASFPTPRSGTVISKCFSNVFRIKSCSCFLTKVSSPLSNCWWPQQQGCHTLLGMTRLCSVTVFCTEMGSTPLDAAGCRLSATDSEVALLVHSSHRNPCLQCAIRFYSQPLGLLRATPPVPFSVLFFLTSALGAATSNHPPSAGWKRKFRKK